MDTHTKQNKKPTDIHNKEMLTMIMKRRKKKKKQRQKTLQSIQKVELFCQEVEKLLLFAQSF